MISIRPVSDLRNKYPEVEAEVIKQRRPVFLTKNGSGAMVLMSLEQYDYLTDYIESALDDADMESEITEVRMSADDVFNHARSVAHA